MHSDSSGNRRFTDDYVPLGRKIRSLKVIHRACLLDKKAMKEQLVKRRAICRLNAREEYWDQVNDINQIQKLPETKQFKTIKEFSLRIYNHCGNRNNWVKFGQWLKRLSSVQEIYIDLTHGEHVSNIRMIQIAHALKRFRALKKIRFNANCCPKKVSSGLSCLKKALKRLPSLQSLSIDNTCSLLAVGKALNRTSSLRKLDISFHSGWFDIDDNQLSNFLQFLSRNESLLSLNLSITRITDQHLSRLGEILKKNVLLKNLNLSFSQSERTGEGLTNLQKGLKELVSLQSLNLCFGCCKEIGKAKSADFSKLTSLKDVCLRFESDQKLCVKGLSKLGQTLKSLPVLQKIQIYLSGSEKMSAKGLLALMNGLKGVISLEDLFLDFSACETLGEKHLSAIGKGLQGFISLRNLKLDFEYCRNLTDEGFGNFSYGFHKMACLQKIYLSFNNCCKVTDKALSGLGKGLENLKSLEEMTLSFDCSDDDICPISDEGVLSLSKSLENLVFLKKIKLYTAHSKIGDKGFEGLCKSLNILTLLQNINLGLVGSLISDEGIKKAGEPLKRLKAVEELCIRFEYCWNSTAEEGKNLKEMLKKRLPQASIDVYWFERPQMDDCS